MEDKNRFKLLSYNLHKGFTAANLRFVLKEIREAMKNTQSDVAVLQEIQGAHQTREIKIEGYPAIPQVDYLLSAIGSHSVYGKNATYQQGHHGNAILSKFPIQRHDNINVSRFSQFSRSLLHAEINLPNQKVLHVICVHFSITQKAKLGELPRLLAHIEDAIELKAPLIVAGDFNDWRGKIEHHFDGQWHLKEAFESMHGRFAKTFPSWFPILPLDRVYFRNLDLVDAKVLQRLPWSKLSDHLPLWVEFGF